jgi:hypothetical protein
VGGIAHSLDEFDEMPAESDYPGARIRAAIEQLDASL